MARREFDEHMASGRRYVRDLPDTWRTQQDRLQLTRDARHEFVRAFGIAERMNEPYLQALAEVAIAGCWLWVPSLPDARKAMEAARKILEPETLRGGSFVKTAYSDVLALCQAYGENGDLTIEQSNDKINRPSSPAAQLKYFEWVGHAGIEVKVVHPEFPHLDYGSTGTVTGKGPSGLVIPVAAMLTFRLKGRPGEQVPLMVRNTRSEWISVSLTYAAIVVRLPENKTLPAENRVAPGAVAEMILTRPSWSATSRTTLRSTNAAVTFLLPESEDLMDET